MTVEEKLPIETYSYWLGFHKPNTIFLGGHCKSKEQQCRESASKIKQLNIIGYFPVVGAYSGIQRFKFALKVHRDPKAAPGGFTKIKRVMAVRGTMEIFCLGFVFILVDIPITFKRYKELNTATRSHLIPV